MSSNYEILKNVEQNLTQFASTFSYINTRLRLVKDHISQRPCLSPSFYAKLQSQTTPGTKSNMKIVEEINSNVLSAAVKFLRLKLQLERYKRETSHFGDAELNLEFENVLGIPRETREKRRSMFVKKYGIPKALPHINLRKLEAIKCKFHDLSATYKPLAKTSLKPPTIPTPKSEPVEVESSITKPDPDFEAKKAMYESLFARIDYYNSLIKTPPSTGEEERERRKRMEARRKEGPEARRKEIPGVRRKDAGEVRRKNVAELRPRDVGELRRKQEAEARRKEAAEARRKEAVEARRKEFPQVRRKGVPEVRRTETPKKPKKKSNGKDKEEEPWESVPVFINRNGATSRMELRLMDQKCSLYDERNGDGASEIGLAARDFNLSLLSEIVQKVKHQRMIKEGTVGTVQPDEEDEVNLILFLVKQSEEDKAEAKRTEEDKAEAKRNSRETTASSMKKKSQEQTASAKSKPKTSEKKVKKKKTKPKTSHHYISSLEPYNTKKTKPKTSHHYISSLEPYNTYNKVYKC